MIKRILIVGFGSIGKRHLKLARQMVPDADIRVLLNHSQSGSSSFANGFFFSLDEAILFFPQIAIIANPAPFHIGIAKSLADIGTHLLIEKPISDSLNGVQELIDKCELAKVILQVGYNLRFLPSLSRFREFIYSGIIGKVLSFRSEVGQYLPSWRPGSDYRLGVSARRNLGGGVLLELSHELDYLRWIFGEVEWVKAELCKQSNLEIDVEDTAHLIFGFVRSNDASQIIGTINLDFIRHDRVRLCTVIGEKGSIVWDGLKGEVKLYDQNFPRWKKLYKCSNKIEDSYIAEWNHFLACVNEQREPCVSGSDGFEVLKIINGARCSNKSHGNLFRLNSSKGLK